MLRFEQPAFAAEDHGAFNYVLEFAHVAGPLVACEHGFGRFGKTLCLADGVLPGRGVEHQQHFVRGQRNFAGDNAANRGS